MEVTNRSILKKVVMVFGRRKEKHKQEDKKAAERNVRKLLGKDTERRVFGFKCSPDIPATLKTDADGLHVPLFALAEHILQLGAMQLPYALRDPEEREELRRHLIEDHIQRRTIEKISRYDQETADWLDGERRRRFQIDRDARVIAARFGPRLDVGRIEEIIDLGTRAKVAMNHGAPPPPPIPRFGYRRRPQRAPSQRDQGSDSPHTPDLETGGT